MKTYDYERDPAAIYRQSFATVNAEAGLDRFAAELRPLVTRMIHACGHVPLADQLAASDDLVPAALAALRAGGPLLCDCEMLTRGIIQRLLPAQNPVRCTLNGESVPARAVAIGNTRSAAAVEDWLPELPGAVVVIGNAPTALFALLEHLHAGAEKPAAIIGIPVGFVGAAESKQALAESYAELAVPFVTVHGRLGGSAIAAAAVNALGGLAAGKPDAGDRA